MSSSKDPLTPFTYKGAPGEDYSHEQEYTTNVGDLRPSNIMNLINAVTAQEYWKPYLQSNLSDNVFRKIKFI